MDRSCGFVLLLVMLVLVQLVDLGVSVPDKCVACKAVAEEIESSLANERPRNHLDLRHRLDSKGQREGKVIDYKVSELRVVELLDGLCAKFKSYTLTEGETGYWMKIDFVKLTGKLRMLAEAQSKELVSYCGRLLETTEDELTSKIQKGEVQAGDVETVLCTELSKHCEGVEKHHEHVEDIAAAGGSDGEL